MCFKTSAFTRKMTSVRGKWSKMGGQGLHFWAEVLKAGGRSIHSWADVHRLHCWAGALRAQVIRAEALKAKAEVVRG